MKHIVLASTSTLYGEGYLAYLQLVMQTLFAGVSEIIFVPFARPGGISHDEYTARAAAAFAPLQIQVKGLLAVRRRGIGSDVLESDDGQLRGDFVAAAEASEEVVKGDLMAADEFDHRGAIAAPECHHKVQICLHHAHPLLLPRRS